MIDVTRIDHISMAVRELEPQIELLERLFGFRYHGRFVQPGYIGAELEVPGRSGIVWEVLAPDGPDSYLHRFLDGENGPGLHHLSMQIRDMDGAVETMRGLGIEPWGYEVRDAGGGAEDAMPVDGAQRDSVAYIHPRTGGAGFLFQLYEGSPWYLPDPFEDERSDTLGIIAVSALGHAHHSRQELGDWYEQLFGFKTLHQPASSLSELSFSTRTLETPRSQLRIEVMQPTREDSFLQSFLDRRGAAVHHVSFEVRDIHHAIGVCERNGVRVLGAHSSESEGALWDEAFLAPEHTGGILVHLFAWQPLQASPPTGTFRRWPSEPGPTDEVASEAVKPASAVSDALEEAAGGTDEQPIEPDPPPDGDDQRAF